MRVTVTLANSQSKFLESVKNNSPRRSQHSTLGMQHTTRGKSLLFCLQYHRTVVLNGIICLISMNIIIPIAVTLWNKCAQQLR